MRPWQMDARAKTIIHFRHHIHLERIGPLILQLRQDPVYRTSSPEPRTGNTSGWYVTEAREATGERLMVLV
jgi:hypothetical protein